MQRNINGVTIINQIRKNTKAIKEKWMQSPPNYTKGHDDFFTLAATLMGPSCVSRV